MSNDAPPISAADAGTIFTTQTVADQFGVHERTIRRLVQSGDLESFRMGTRIRIAQSHLDAYLRRSSATATGGAA